MKTLAVTCFAALLISTISVRADDLLKVILSEDFESTAVGEIPAGFIKAGAVAVAEDVAHSGKHSLRMEASTRGGRTITKKGDEITALGGQHWGRLYFKAKLPVPAPVIPEGKTSGIIHATMVGGKATSPLANDPIEVRMMGIIENMNGSFKYLYNVQPKLRPEFAKMGKKPMEFGEKWALIEWFIDYETQTYKFFVDSEEQPEMGFSKGSGKFEGAEIPAVFDSLTFGFTNYQPAAGEGFVSWIDDIALGKERIGDKIIAKAVAKK